MQKNTQKNGHTVIPPIQNCYLKCFGDFSYLQIYEVPERVLHDSYPRPIFCSAIKSFNFKKIRYSCYFFTRVNLIRH